VRYEASQSRTGRRIALSASRRIIGDLLHFAQRVPTVPVQKTLRLREVYRLRAALPERPGWCAIFTKAYALVADAFPELRRAYLPWPWPHLYEHPISIASVAIEREYAGERCVFFTHIRAPDRQALPVLDRHLRRCKSEPVEHFGLFRRALRVGRWPAVVRRTLWRIGLYGSGRKRARRLGTFGVTSYAALGAESLHPLSPLTTTLTYGVLQRGARLAVRVVYDHRVLDGAVVARALAFLEEVLHGAIADELRALSRSPTADRGKEAC